MRGDGENLPGNFIDVYKEVRNASRQTKLQALAQVSGIYVLSLYDVSYHTLDGTVKSIQPIDLLQKSQMREISRLELGSIYDLRTSKKLKVRRL